MDCKLLTHLRFSLHSSRNAKFLLPQCLCNEYSTPHLFQTIHSYRCDLSVQTPYLYTYIKRLKTSQTLMFTHNCGLMSSLELLLCAAVCLLCVLSSTDYAAVAGILPPLVRVARNPALGLPPFTFFGAIILKTTSRGWMNLPHLIPNR